MKKFNLSAFINGKVKVLLGFLLLLSVTVNAQQLQMTDFALFSGAGGTGTTTPPSPGYGVQLGSSTSVSLGSIGSFKLVQTTGTSSISGNINARGTVVLANSNTVTGKITTANFYAATGTILSVGSSANLGGNLDVSGNIVVGGGTVTGKATHPTGTTYTGPAPAGGNVTGIPSLPTMPNLPVINTFSPYPNLPDITSTTSITPGAYDDIKLSGNKTLTFNGPGIYVFDKIDNTGSNNFVFNFQNSATGTFKIYIHNDAFLNKISVSTINGGAASRIYCEVHGTAASTFTIANGTASSHAKWLGTVWAPYGAINIGSGSGNCDITGALWSGTQVNIQSGVAVPEALVNAKALVPRPKLALSDFGDRGLLIVVGIAVVHQAVIALVVAGQCVVLKRAFREAQLVPAVVGLGAGLNLAAVPHGVSRASADAGLGVDGRQVDELVKQGSVGGWL